MLLGDPAEEDQGDSCSKGKRDQGEVTSRAQREIVLHAQEQAMIARKEGIKGNCDNAKIPGIADTTTTRPTTPIVHSFYSSSIRLNLLPYYVLKN